MNIAAGITFAHIVTGIAMAVVFTGQAEKPQALPPNIAAEAPAAAKKDQAKPAPPAAAKPAPPPVLQEVAKLRIQNGAQRIQIAALKRDSAQAEFEKAREELQQFLLSLQVDGYQLDLNTLSYAPAPPPEKKDK